MAAYCTWTLAHDVSVVIFSMFIMCWGDFVVENIFFKDGLIYSCRPNKDREQGQSLTDTLKF